MFLKTLVKALRLGTIQCFEYSVLSVRPTDVKGTVGVKAAHCWVQKPPLSLSGFNFTDRHCVPHECAEFSYLHLSYTRTNHETGDKL